MKRSGPPKRKTPLKSNKGLGGGPGLKRTELKRGDSQLKRTELKKRSTERSKFMKDDRVPLIKTLVEAGFGCEICPVLHEAGVPIECNGQIEGMHELRKRSSGGSLTNRNNLVPACNWSNGWIENNPTTAHTLGLVVREGDPLWDQLGKRNDDA